MRRYSYIKKEFQKLNLKNGLFLNPVLNFQVEHALCGALAYHFPSLPVLLSYEALSATFKIK